MEAKVKNWNMEKGWGFVTTDEGKDVFVHFTNIQSREGRRNLVVGQNVEIEVQTGPRGDFAVSCTPIPQ